MLVLLINIIVSIFKVYCLVKDKNMCSLGVSYWVFVFIISYNIYYYFFDVDLVVVYYWYFVGVIMKLLEIDKIE